VRWTEQRNFEAVLALMESGAIDVNGLITHRYSLREAGRAYETLLSDRAALESFLPTSRSTPRQPPAPTPFN